MHTYIDTIKQAGIIFPPIAIVFTIPYLIYNYKKYGSIWSLRIWIIYSFMLYLICTYCLIILPLPTPEKAQTLNGYHTQLIPFNFIADIISRSHIQVSNPKSYLTVINNWAFLTTIFNIFMTLPFGFYLKYYFRNNLKQVILKTFLLSLFFELTQLSGLYFIYRGNYRLFDVDDLITNTIGGIFGFLLATTLSRILPTREEIDEKSLDRSKKISLLRRLVAMGFDIITGSIFSFAVVSPIFRHISISSPFIILQVGTLCYMLITTALFNGRSLGFFMTNLKVELDKEVSSSFLSRLFHFFLRYLFFILQFIIIPLLFIMFVDHYYLNNFLNKDAVTVISIAFISIYLLYLVATSILVALRKPIFYEKISKTKLENTTLNKKIQKEQKEQKESDSEKSIE